MNISSKYFIPGDLLHIPEGTVLYHKLTVGFNGGMPKALPRQVADLPTVGLVIDKDVGDYYLVSIKDQEYLIASCDVNLYNEDLKHVY